MNFQSFDKAAKDISKILNERLRNNTKVLWLLSGGSAVNVAVATMKLFETDRHNLIISLTDERFGPVGHADSNWKQLEEAGFPFNKVNALPVLDGQNFEQTATNFDQRLRKIYQQADYKIGLFGIGPDGHTASLFPGLPALQETDRIAVAVENAPKPPPDRITITPTAIKLLDEAIVYAVGQDKWSQLEKLKRNIDPQLQPAQILKQVPRLTIYTDYKESEEIG